MFEPCSHFFHEIAPDLKLPFFESPRPEKSRKITENARFFEQNSERIPCRAAAGESSIRLPANGVKPPASLF
jgi:hypothetical protein